MRETAAADGWKESVNLNATYAVAKASSCKDSKNGSSCFQCLIEVKSFG